MVGLVVVLGGGTGGSARWWGLVVVLGGGTGGSARWWDWW